MVSKMEQRKKPKKWTSWRVCPECNSRATKLFSLNSGQYKCQVCKHEYDPPAGKNADDGSAWLRWMYGV